MTRQFMHVRHGIGSVRPYIHGPVELLDFVTQTFDAVELERHEFGPESKPYHERQAAFRGYRWQYMVGGDLQAAAGLAATAARSPFHL